MLENRSLNCRSVLFANLKLILLSLCRSTVSNIITDILFSWLIIWRLNYLLALTQATNLSCFSLNALQRSQKHFYSLTYRFKGLSVLCARIFWIFFLNIVALPLHLKLYFVAYRVQWIWGWSWTTIAFMQSIIIISKFPDYSIMVFGLEYWLGFQDPGIGSPEHPITQA